ncbi:hypothetical protein AB7W88_03140 [Providencia vermicola]
MAWLYANGRLNLATRLGILLDGIAIEELNIATKAINTTAP